MHELPGAIPEGEVVLALSVEELAGQLLILLRERIAAGRGSHAGIHIANIPDELNGRSGSEPPYGQRTEQVKGAVIEALAWLEAQVLLVPSPGTNGTHGWRFLSRRALEMKGKRDFEHYRSAKLLPRELLHPAVAEKVWLSFVRGEYDTAAFQAMRQVEIAVREATDIEELGVTLARRAFKPKDDRTGEVGPLTDDTAEKGEQHGMMDLFAGALGALKNPHSHRVVNFDSPADAAAVVMFGSQLLRIVENHRARRELLS